MPVYLKPVTKEIPTLVSNALSCENVALTFNSQLHKDLKESVFKGKAANQGTRADTFRCQRLSFFFLSMSIFIFHKQSSPLSPCSSPSLVLTFYHLVNYCPSGFLPSVWHIHRVCEHESELFNPHNAPNWKTAREHHRGRQLSATIFPPPPPRHRWAHQTGSRPCWWEEIR